MEGEEVWWCGASRTSYRFLVAKLGTPLGLIVPGIFILVRYEAQQWQPLYVGHTSDLNQRSAHSLAAIDCLRKARPTHVHVCVEEDELARRRNCADLIKRLRPPCNSL